MSSLPGPFVTISPAGRGITVGYGDVAQGVFRFDTDAIGTTTVTFSGVNADSEIRVYLPDGTEVAGVEDCTADPVLIWSVYSAGSPNNTVTIRIVHPSYKIKEFNYPASAGVVNLPVQQERDPWYSNP